MKGYLPLLLSALLLLSGCAKEPPPPAEGEYSVYFASATLGGAALAPERRSVPPGVEPIEGLLRVLLSGPMDEGLASPIPTGTRLLSWNLGEGGELRLDLSERYGGLAGVELTLADYALALTLFQLPEVETVSITVEGEPVAFRDHQLLRPSDVILSGAEDAPVYITAALYFPLRSGGLLEERRDLLITENDSLPTVLLDALLSGPGEENAYFPPMEDRAMLAVSVEAGECYVNLPSSFVTRVEEAGAVPVLYAIVNTLCAQESISSVRIMVDGASVESIGGVPVHSPLEADLELVAPK